METLVAHALSLYNDPMLGSKTYYVYIMASKRNGTLYTGVTGNLIQRVTRHRNADTPRLHPALPHPSTGIL